MQQNKLSTSDVNNKSIVLLMANALTSHVNNSMANDADNAFGRWVKSLIEGIPFSQAQVAKKTGITDVQLSRIVTGVSGVKSDTAENIIDAINELAGHEIADKTYGLDLAGYSRKNKTEAQRIAERLASGVMASGLNDLEDEELREAFLADMQTIAESMLKRRLEEQEKRKKGK